MSEAEDLFRYCVYCNADCQVDEPEHAADCPSVTGVWPVRAEDRILCPHCGKDIHGPSLCSDCGTPLEAGEHYVYRDVDSRELVVRPGHLAIVEPICVGCAAREGLLADA